MAKAPRTVKDLRALPRPELELHVQKLRQELWQHRLKTKEGALQQTHLIPAARRQIAQALTILRETKAQS